MNRYAGHLMEMAKDSPFLLQHEPPDKTAVMQAVRDRGFQRMIRVLYGDTCSMCGLRLVMPEGHTALEAAHVVPYSECYNDDPRNGLGLCRVHHWCLDEGLVGDDDYRVVVSELLDRKRPTEGRVLELEGAELQLPKDDRLRPTAEALGWHRRHRLRTA